MMKYYIAHKENYLLNLSRPSSNCHTTSQKTNKITMSFQEKAHWSNIPTT